jgi:hypothetical protein
MTPDVPRQLVNGLAIGIVVLAVAGGCAGPGSSFKRPLAELLTPGMSHDDVVTALGKPGRTAHAGRVELLLYGWDDPTDGKIGAATTLVVKLVDGATVAAYWDRGAPPINPPTVADGVVKGLVLGTTAGAAVAAGMAQGAVEAQTEMLREREVEAATAAATAAANAPRHMNCHQTGYGTFSCNEN